MTGYQEQLLGRLSALSCWGVCIVHMCAYIFSLANLHPAQPGGGAGQGHGVCVPAICNRCDWLCIYAHMWFVCVLCEYVSTGNTCLASLRVGPGGMELWLPHLTWTVRSGSVSPINNLSRFACKLYFLSQIKAHQYTDTVRFAMYCLS